MATSAVDQYPGGKMTQDHTNAFSPYYGLHQIIAESTPFSKRLTSFIYFTNEPNLIVDSGVHPPIYQN